MAWTFGDGFDCYANGQTDPPNGYWDSAPGLNTATAMATGRFAGSRALQWGAQSATASLVKASAVNDAVHHIVVAVYQSASLTGTNPCFFVHLRDGTTAQCSIVFRSDGAILLTSGIHTGTTLATYTGAITTTGTWFAFEIEVVINNTTGSFTVRKNGNNVNDFTLGSLNTRGGTANNYANSIGIGNGNTAPGHIVDDFFWRSDAASVPWMGDIRCYTRMPASDASVQFAKSTPTYTQAAGSGSSTQAISVNVAMYQSFTAAYSGTTSSLSVVFGGGTTTCNMKCSLFASTGSAPAAILGSATPLALSAATTATFTFGTPVTLVKGTQYWVGFIADATSGSFTSTVGATGAQNTIAYASWPTASPVVSAIKAPIVSLIVGTTLNAEFVNEPQQDATTSYVYDSTPGHADFYGIASIAATPVSTFMVTTRGYMQKSDVGTRTANVQLKSGVSTVASSTLTLTTSGWLWSWRADLVDPATGSAWTAAAVNAVQIGPSVVA